MKVILETDVSGLGEEGTIVHVSPGYARNYLFPQKKAVQHTAQNSAVLKSRMKAISRRREEKQKLHLSVKERLEREQHIIAMTTSEKGHLYGAVTAQVIADALAKQEIHIPKSNIILPGNHSIKDIGTYTIIAKLYHGVQAHFTVVVTDTQGHSTSTTASQETQVNVDVPPQSTDEKDKETQQVAEEAPARNEHAEDAEHAAQQSEVGEPLDAQEGDAVPVPNVDE